MTDDCADKELSLDFMRQQWMYDRQDLMKEFLGRRRYVPANYKPWARSVTALEEKRVGYSPEDIDSVTDYHSPAMKRYMEYRLFLEREEREEELRKSKDVLEVQLKDQSVYMEEMQKEERMQAIIEAAAKTMEEEAAQKTNEDAHVMINAAPDANGEETEEEPESINILVDVNAEEIKVNGKEVTVEATPISKGSSTPNKEIVTIMIVETASIASSVVEILAEVESEIPKADATEDAPVDAPVDVPADAPRGVPAFEEATVKDIAESAYPASE